MAATTDCRNGSLRTMIWGNIQGATTPATWRPRMQEKKLEPCMRIASQSAKDRQGKLADRYGYLPTRSPILPPIQCRRSSQKARGCLVFQKAPLKQVRVPPHQVQAEEVVIVGQFEACYVAAS